MPFPLKKNFSGTIFSCPFSSMSFFSRVVSFTTSSPTVSRGHFRPCLFLLCHSLYNFFPHYFSRPLPLVQFSVQFPSTLLFAAIFLYAITSLGAISRGLFLSCHSLLAIPFTISFCTISCDHLFRAIFSCAIPFLLSFCAISRGLFLSCRFLSVFPLRFPSALFSRSRLFHAIASCAILLTISHYFSQPFSSMSFPLQSPLVLFLVAFSSMPFLLGHFRYNLLLCYLL